MSVLPDLEINLETDDLPAIPLPNGWSELTLQAVLHVITLARIVLLNAHHWPDGAECDTLRLRAENDRLKSEIALLQCEIEIKDARFSRLEPKRRPHYLPHERLEILIIQAARGLRNIQIAKRFQVTLQTIRNWIQGKDKDGTTVQIAEKPTRYPDFVRYIVQQFKACCPMLGRYQIANIFARTGLHMSASTVKRCIDEPPIDPPKTDTLPENPSNETDKPGNHEVQAWYPDHVWSGDLTEVSTSNGFWCHWRPFAVPQQHPYCWWVYVVIDHFSRRLMGLAIFKTPPTSEDICREMDRICTESKVKPKYFVSDKGIQFDSHPFRKWCRDNGVKNRCGAVGKHGSIAVTERVIKSLKYEYLNRIVVPLSHGDMENEVRSYTAWYNEFRPHARHLGRTPNEVYFNRRAANTLPRIEPRKFAKHSTPCAAPRTMIRGKAGANIKLVLDFHEGNRLLPIVKFERV
ncbi:MAG: DDE-type integrase/transposase/recombinase [Planctomycetaceae bacterium]|nr:DDE-type integrase/transposase/recombinase [Planctomycetaceae bacterium]